MTADRREQTWILLRGLAREAAHWESFPDLLRKRLGTDASILTVDLPGMGKHCEGFSPWNIPDILQSVREDALRQIGSASSQVWLAGMSLGGMVALEWSRQYAAELRGAILINTSIGGTSKPWHRMKLQAWWPLLRVMLCRDAQERERRILQLTSNTVPDFAMLERRAEVDQLRPLRWNNVFRQLVAASRYRPLLHQTDVPLLLLGSAADRLVSPRCSMDLQLATGASLRMHGLANHDLTLDDPEWTAKEMVDWSISAMNGKLLRQT